MADYLDALKYELHAGYDGEERSFLIDLKVYKTWSKTAFYRLAKTMLQACIAGTEDEKLERWVAGGFHMVNMEVYWYLDDEESEKEHSSQYYGVAKALLLQLSYFYFTGENPFKSIDDFETQFAKIAPE